jgi:acylphosphatase
VRENQVLQQIQRDREVRESHEMRELHAHHTSSHSSQQSSNTQILEEEQIKIQDAKLESFKSHFETSLCKSHETMAEISTSVSATQQAMALQISQAQEQMALQFSQQTSAIAQILEKLALQDLTGSFTAAEALPEKVKSEESVSVESASESAGITFSGIPVGDPGDDGDQALEQLIEAAGGDVKGIPKNLRDGSTLKAKFYGNPSEDVVDFLEQVEDQLAYCEKHFWVMHVLNSALGPKALTMAKQHQKTLVAGRLPDRTLRGKVCVVPGGKFANWKELKEWLLEHFYKPEQELMKMAEIIKNHDQGKNSFAEYQSTLLLELGQCKTPLPDDWVKVLLIDGMRASTWKRLQVEPDLVNGPLPEFLRITSKYDTAEYIASKAVGAIAQDDPEGGLAP